MAEVIGIVPTIYRFGSVNQAQCVLNHPASVRKSAYVATDLPSSSAMTYGCASDTLSTEKLTADAMALPLSERVSLAQALWESNNAGLPEAEKHASIIDAIRRDEDLSSDRVAGRTHEKVILAAALARM